MKARLLLFGLILLPTLCMAQFGFSIRGGINCPKFHCVSAVGGDLNSQIGYLFGTVYSFEISEYVSFQVETNFSQINYTELIPIETKISDTPEYIRYKGADKSMDFPIILKYDPWDIDLNFNCGFQNIFSFTETGSSTHHSVIRTRDRYNYGILIGLAYEVVDRLVIDTRYIFGINKSYIVGSHYRRNVWELSIGYQIF